MNIFLVVVVLYCSCIGLVFGYIFGKYREKKLEKFARWVAEEIIDEDMWEYNYLSFAELACRKLVKLGIMQESNGEYLYEETKSEADNGNDD